MNDIGMDLSSEDLRNLLSKARKEVEDARSTISDAAKWLQEAQAKGAAFEVVHRIQREEEGNGGAGT